MSEGYVQIPPDNSGKKIRTLTLNLGSGSIYMEVTPIAFGSGMVVDLTQALPVQIRPSAVPGVAIGARKALTSASGGLGLTSAAVRSVRVKAGHFNSGDIYVGAGTGALSQRPYSGYGYALLKDEYVDIATDQAGEVFGFAEISGYGDLTYLGTV